MISALLSLAQGVKAQQADVFTVASLNVDGLPLKILVFKVNANGPGDAGTSRMGKYLSKKNYDMIFMQEDFNYHDVMTPWLEDNYKLDSHSGRVDIDVEGEKVDFLHLQNHRFKCDGLMAAWKNDIQVTATLREAWKQNFGKFSHALDEIVTKGFRRYEMKLANGYEIVVYNMHMDAGDNVDEVEFKDANDRAARHAQWMQLKDDILQKLDSRPVIVVGDLNSYYYRDKIKADFIEAIAATGKATVNDAFVELKKAGAYPAYSDKDTYRKPLVGNLLDGEGPDKILYINPVNGAKIKAVSFDVDVEGYKYEDKALGDHYPVSATFEFSGKRPSAIANISVLEDVTAPVEYYNLNGQRIDKPAKGVYVERRGNVSVKRTAN